MIFLHSVDCFLFGTHSFQFGAILLSSFAFVSSTTGNLGNCCLCLYLGVFPPVVSNFQVFQMAFDKFQVKFVFGEGLKSGLGLLSNEVQFYCHHF